MGAQNNGKGTLVDTLHYRFVGLEIEGGRLTAEADEQVDPASCRVASKTVPVEVRLIKHFNREAEGSNRPVDRVEFALSCKNPEFRIKGPDIEILRRAVWDHLDSELRVHWEHYYLVQVEPEIVYRGRGCGMSFIYRNVERGVAHDGTLLLREYRGHEHVITAWPGEFRDERNKLMACIPATDANTAALEEFAKMIDEMRKRLAQFFRPEQIMRTLQNLGALKMLESGAPEMRANN